MKKVAAVDNDFVMHIAETEIKDRNLDDVVSTMFSDLKVEPIMHELVYKYELEGGADSKGKTIALNFFSEGIISQKLMADFLDSESKKNYYKTVLKKIYYDFKGPLPSSISDILIDWASSASLGETHTMAMCAMINCGIFLSDDKGSSKLAHILKRQYAFDVKTYNREEAIKYMTELGTSIKKHDRNALKHVAK